jgi:superfamily I DNA and/or RNA helicase
MDYFRRQLELLKLEKEADRKTWEQLASTLSVTDRRANGMTWFPVAIKEMEIGRGDYLTVEVERTTHQEIIHQLRFGMTVALFSNHDAKNDRVEGTVSFISGNRMKVSLRTDELPDWTRNGKLGIDAVFDEASYSEMESALKTADQRVEKKEEGYLIGILTGTKKAGFHHDFLRPPLPRLNEMQQAAVDKILAASDLAIVHGPPGTGKTTTLVQAIKALYQRDRRQVLVVAPSNAAIDLLSEKLSEEGLNVVRVGNPARVSENGMALTLDSRMATHSNMKEIKRLKKQAAEFRDMAQKYKRNFGPQEREQRKALFAEARNISREIEKTEQYISEDVLSRAQVITATLIGANHYSVRHLKYDTVVIDEAGQALEPACWVPVLKGRKLIMAGDHCQLPPTIRSLEAAKELGKTLLEKCVALHPEAVVLLEEQYRMHETIMRFSSQEFYKGYLKAHESVAQRVLFEGDKPLLFIDTAGCGYEEKQEGTRLSNGEEAALLVKHLGNLWETLMITNAESLPTIGVISPYKQQVELLKEEVNRTLGENQASITVNTIDSFQGQERDIIYISMVRSNPDNVIGFLSEIRRMNVAMTRAKKKLVVIGDSATLSQFPFYADFIEYVQNNNGYVSAWELMEL